MKLLPQKYFLCSGTGRSMFDLNAAHKAMIQAGVGHLNLIKVSSIIPRGAKLQKNHPSLTAGALTHSAYILKTTNFQNSPVFSAGVGVALPPDDVSEELPGVIMKYSGYDEKSKCSKELERMTRLAFQDLNHVVPKEIIVICETGFKDNLSKDEKYLAIFCGVIFYDY